MSQIEPVEIGPMSQAEPVRQVEPLEQMFTMRRWLFGSHEPIRLAGIDGSSFTQAAGLVRADAGDRS